MTLWPRIRNMARSICSVGMRSFIVHFGTGSLAKATWVYWRGRRGRGRRIRRDTGEKRVDGEEEAEEGAACGLLGLLARVSVEVGHNGADHTDECKKGHDLVKECELWHRCPPVLPANMRSGKRWEQVPVRLLRYSRGRRSQAG